jgi:pSer/pThr/pTyr-binding forkhead associated (FHA) protein
MPPRLIAMTDSSRRSINADSLTIDRLPFRVGRDSRSASQRLASEVERRQGFVGQLNDAYIFEDAHAKFLHVSREHFLIDAEHGHFYLSDRHSVCGTIVAGKSVGGERTGGRIELHDQDVIVVGTAASPYSFRFVSD